MSNVSSSWQLSSARRMSYKVLASCASFAVSVVLAYQLARDISTNNKAAIEYAVRFLHYLHPVTLLLYWITASAISVCTFKTLRSTKHPKTANRKKLVFTFSIGIIVTYILQGTVSLIRLVKKSDWVPTKDENVYILATTFVWGILQLALLDSKYVIWYPFIGCWLLSIVFESYLVIIDLHRVDWSTILDFAWAVIIICRLILLVLLPALFYSLPQTRGRAIFRSSDEEQYLLGKQGESGIENEVEPDLGVYGSFLDSDSDDERTKKTKAKLAAKWEESGNWWNYARSFSIFWPMIWPSENYRLQFSIVLIGITLIGQSILNVLVPRQFGIVTDSFLNAVREESVQTTQGSSIWLQVSFFVLFKLLQSNAGLLALKDYLWIPIDQYSYRMITTTAYNHIMSLSYDFHADKRSGELFASINNARSINWFIEMMLFTFIPMLVDLGVAFIYLYSLFGPYMALLVAFVTITFLWTTTRIGQHNQATRRDFIKASRKESDTMWETVSHWQNISYFSRIPHEQERYLKAIVDLQAYERKWTLGLALLKFLQSFIFTSGLLAACFLAVHEILNGHQPVGSFVTLLLYWTQLSGPLTFFGDFFRRLNTSMIDAERLLEILNLKPTVSDKENAAKLNIVHGNVTFDNICFAHDDRKPAVKGMSLDAKAGSTVAFVGETGAGKSTLLKLLFRFYDVQKGSIKIDGQDIRDVTLDSLRDNIGVVPQDPSLFNDTIMNNLRYANFNATDSDIYRACEAAAIHSKILTFPDGYNSKVGERGVKLSGGELQRLAIARAILKNTKIVLLDEATSMVDLDTEGRIQNAFKELAKGRTTFVVAHRLSTIINADQIVVFHEGKIQEIGNHDHLLSIRGTYYRLWNKQIRAEGSQVTEMVASSNDPLPEYQHLPGSSTESLTPCPQSVPTGKVVGSKSRQHRRPGNGVSYSKCIGNSGVSITSQSLPGNITSITKKSMSKTRLGACKHQPQIANSHILDSWPQEALLDTVSVSCNSERTCEAAVTDGRGEKAQTRLAVAFNSQIDFNQTDDVENSPDTIGVTNEVVTQDSKLWVKDQSHSIGRRRLRTTRHSNSRSKVRKDLTTISVLRRSLQKVAISSSSCSETSDVMKVADKTAISDNSMTILAPRRHLCKTVIPSTTHLQNSFV